MVRPARSTRNSQPTHDHFRDRPRLFKRRVNRVAPYWQAHKAWYTTNIDTSLLEDYVQHGGLDARAVINACGSEGRVKALYPSFASHDLNSLATGYRPREGDPPQVSFRTNIAVALTTILRYSVDEEFRPFDPEDSFHLPDLSPMNFPEVEDLLPAGLSAPMDSTALHKTLLKRYPSDIVHGPYSPMPNVFTHGQPIPGPLVRLPPVIDVTQPSWTYSHTLVKQEDIWIQVWQRQPSIRQIVVKHIRSKSTESWHEDKCWYWHHEEGVSQATNWCAEAYSMYRLSACPNSLGFYGVGYNDASETIRIGMQCADFGDLNRLCDRRSLAVTHSQYHAAFNAIMASCDGLDTSTNWTRLRAEKQPNMTVRDREWADILRYLIDHSNKTAIQDPMRQLLLRAAIPESFIWYAFRSLATALEAMEKENLIHRDIKTSNIFMEVLTDDAEIAENGGWIYRVLLADFGETVHRLDPRPVNTLGTGFEAPESWEANKYTPEDVTYVVSDWLDHSADIFAIAAVIWCIMDPHLGTEGLPVYDPDANRWGHVHQFSPGDPDEPYEEHYDLQPMLIMPSLYSNQLQDLVRECLQRDSTLRPTAQELLDAIEGEIAAGTVEAAPTDGGLTYFADLCCGTCHRHEKMCTCPCADCGQPNPDCTCFCPHCKIKVRYACACPP